MGMFHCYVCLLEGRSPNTSRMKIRSVESPEKWIIGSWFLVWSQWQATIGIGAAWNQRLFVQDDCRQLGFLLPLCHGNFGNKPKFLPMKKHLIRTSLNEMNEMNEMNEDHKFRFLQSILLLPPTTTTYYCLRSPNFQSRPSNATAAGLRCSSQYVWAAGFARCCWTLWLDAKWLSRHHTFDPQRLPGAIQEDHVR